LNELAFCGKLALMKERFSQLARPKIPNEKPIRRLQPEVPSPMPKREPKELPKIPLEPKIPVPLKS